MPRTTYHHGALRQALIDGAREILAERGHEQFSLNEVARRAGVSTAAPYRHFANKDELLAAVALQGYQTLLQDLEQERERAADVSAAERLLRLSGAYVRFAKDHPDLYVTMFRRLLLERPSGPGSFELLVAAVADAQREGALSSKPSAELLARSIWAALHGLSELILRRPHDQFGLDGPPEALARDTLSALLGL